MKKLNSKDLKKSSNLESKGACIVDTHMDTSKWKHIKKIARILGSFVNNHILLSYVSIIIGQLILQILNVNSIVTFIIVLIAFIGLYNSHKFYINEIIKTNNANISISKNRHRKSAR